MRPTRSVVPVIALATLLFLLAGCMTPKKGPRKAFSRAEKEGRTPFDVVIIPGIPYENVGWDTVMKARVLWSWILYKNGYARNVIYSGGAVYTPYKEAIVMGLYAQALGIPKKHIFHDTLATHSTENVYYSYLLAQKLGFKSIALATDPFQSFLLRGFTRKRFSTNIYLLPFVTDSLKAYNHLNPVINPQPARVRNWQSITEKHSFWTRFKGTLGKDINFSQYPKGKVGAL